MLNNILYLCDKYLYNEEEDKMYVNMELKATQFT